MIYAQILSFSRDEIKQNSSSNWNVNGKLSLGWENRFHLCEQRKDFLQDGTVSAEREIKSGETLSENWNGDGIWKGLLYPSLPACLKEIWRSIVKRL